MHIYKPYSARTEEAMHHVLLKYILLYSYATDRSKAQVYLGKYFCSMINVWFTQSNGVIIDL